MAVLGVLPLMDPVREYAASTIATAAHMGVSVKMITGDALEVAKGTAQKVALGTNILDAAGQLEVSIGRSTFPATCRLLEVEGSVRVFAEHAHRNNLVRPVASLVPGSKRSTFRTIR